MLTAGPRAASATSQLIEIRKLKARVEAERLPRGADPAKHTKLGPGGIADVEWTVQLLQLQHAYRLPQLRSTRTVTALRAARDAGVIDPMDAGHLEAAWTLASRIRNQIMLMRGRGSDSLPSDNRELAGVAELLGYKPGESSHLLADYRRVTRQARKVVDRVFWGACQSSAVARFLPDRDVAAALAGEGFPVPAAPPLGRVQSGDTGHEIQFGGPHITVWRRERSQLTIDDPVVVRDRELSRDVVLLEADVRRCGGEQMDRFPGRQALQLGNVVLDHKASARPKLSTRVAEGRRPARPAWSGW